MTTLQSVLLFYRRISSSGASKSFHLLILLMSIFQGLTTTIWFFLTVFSCAPAYAYWARFNDAWQNISYNTYTCNLAGPTPVIIMSIISIIQDFVCAAVPFLIIYKLKVPRRQRIAIFVIFFFAFAACIIAGMSRDLTSGEIATNHIISRKVSLHLPGLDLHWRYRLVRLQCLGNVGSRSACRHDCQLLAGGKIHLSQLL